MGFVGVAAQAPGDPTGERAGFDQGRRTVCIAVAVRHALPFAVEVSMIGAK
jgi:hypothetical protein